MPEVLVVDDYAPIVETLTIRLNRAGIKTDSATNGEEALQKLCERTVDDDLYDAIVLDIQMPIVNGWEVLSAIKNNPLWEAIDVIVLTGATDAVGDIRKVIDYDGVFVGKKEGCERIVTDLMARILPTAK